MIIIKNIEQRPFIFGSIFALSNRLQILGDRIYKEITIKQWFLLAVISQFKDEPPNLVQVSKIIGSSYQNVKKMALILEKKEFLSLVKDKNDSRILRLYMTKKCMKYFETTVNQEEKLIDSLFKGFDDETLTALYEAMSKLVANAELMEEENFE